MRFRKPWAIRLLLAALICAAAPVGGSRLRAQAVGPDEMIRSVLAAGRHRNQRWPLLSDVMPVLRTLYAGSGGAPVWRRDGVPTPSAALVLQQLMRLEVRGLAPSDYDAPRLQSLLDSVRLSAAACCSSMTSTGTTGASARCSRRVIRTRAAGAESGRLSVRLRRLVTHAEIACAAHVSVASALVNARYALSFLQSLMSDYTGALDSTTLSFGGSYAGACSDRTHGFDCVNARCCAPAEAQDRSTAAVFEGR